MRSDYFKTDYQADFKFQLGPSTSKPYARGFLKLEFELKFNYKKFMQDYPPSWHKRNSQ